MVAALPFLGVVCVLLIYCDYLLILCRWNVILILYYNVADQPEVEAKVAGNVP